MSKERVSANAPIETVLETVVSNARSNIFASQLANAVEEETPTFFEKIATDTGEMEVSKKVYQFANPIGKRNSLTVYNLEVIKTMELIDKALKGKTLLTYTICKGFSKIEESGELEKMGFKTVAEFGKAIYGLETSTVNHYARIGKNFINDDFTVKGGLPELSVGHFIELSSQVVEGNITPVIELYASGTLTDGMSTKKVRETLKGLGSNAIEQKATTETKTETTVAGSGESVETPVSELQADFDSQVVVGKIVNACSYISELFSLLNEHEINAIGYQEHIDSIKALAKALL